ncbi:hypothetical protein SNE40_004981 [Patella caerulea]|uniref:Uncharacterized protein n=1 Tax=Patella caerulea TaxID=87958 RepID=A0AAN8K6L9_PATCE
MNGTNTTNVMEKFAQEAAEQMQAFYYILAFITVYISSFILCLLKYVKFRKKCSGENNVYRPLLKVSDSEVSFGEETTVEQEEQIDVNSKMLDVGKETTV